MFKSGLHRLCFYLAMLWGIGHRPALATLADPSAYERLRQSTEHTVRQKLGPLLSQYCGSSCETVAVEIDLAEKIPDVHELGFESLDENAQKVDYYVDSIRVDIQIDRRITQDNREKLKQILLNHLKNIGISVSINLLPIELPYIGESASLAQILRNQLRRELEEAVRKVMQKYCPNTCILSDIAIQGQLMTPDEAKGLDPREIITSETEHTIFHVERVTIALTLDEKISEAERKSIVDVIRARTRFVKPVLIEETTAEFPESYSEKKERLARESQDPYGLEKLRQMLTMFRELAGTKEIISRSENSSESEKNSSNLSSEESSWILYGVVILIFVGLGFLLLRLAQVNRDAKMMMHAVTTASEPEGRYGGGAGNYRRGLAPEVPRESSEEQEQNFRRKLRLKELKDELIQIFMSAPKVAKETFTRMLQEDGVEETAKYVFIFGKMIIFELLSDPNLQRRLYELSEYYHKSSFDFKPEEEIRLLLKLKTRVTANEIKVLAENTIDQFDFLTRLDASQIHALVVDESPKVQSIVLAQLSPKRRRLVFDMFAGKDRVRLMHELCRTDVIPREFLFNVATALSKKVMSKPEFDGQNLRSIDIILELVEKSSLLEQKLLMKNLLETNAEAARVVKLKLVTIETLPYLKDGHLLELVLGMEREDLVNFLAGCAEHIKRLLLSHAPRELAASWLEDLEMVVTIDENNYRLVELKILNKIRQMASNGAINLLDINEIIFADLSKIAADEEAAKHPVIDARNLVA